MVQFSNPSFSPLSLFLKDPAGGVVPWFHDQEVNFCVNARSAIRKTCDLFGLVPGDEALAPAYNCGSEIDPFFDCGASVRLYRVDRNLLIDLSDLEKRITERTKVVYVTHYFGFPQPEIEKIAAMCKRRGLFLIEDCALALFSKLDDRRLGSFGDVSVFCFYKYFPVIGGGALIVNNSGLKGRTEFSNMAPAGFVWKSIARETLYNLFGVGNVSRFAKMARNYVPFRKYVTLDESTNNLEYRYSKKLPNIPVQYYFDPMYRNASISRLTERSLRYYSISNTIEKRRSNFLTYLKLFQNSKIECIYNDLPDGVCPFAFPVVVRMRDQICDHLNEFGIPTTPWWKGFHQRLDWTDFSETMALKEEVLALPLHQYLEQAHVAEIAERLIDHIAKY